MPKVKSSKRRVETGPLVVDPFSASKRNRKLNNEENLKDVDENLKKTLVYDEKLAEAKLITPEKTLDSSKENADESNESKEENELIDKKTEKDKTKKTETKKVETKKTETKKTETKKTDTKETESINFKYDKEAFKNPSNNKEWNYKIASWNVNGVRAWLEKDGLDYVKAEDPDICCFQELKCEKSKIPSSMNLTGYNCFWLAGDTKGYAGVGLISKEKPINVTYELDEKKFAEEGRTLIAEFDKFFLINSYIPNSGRGLVRLDYRMEWEKAFRKKLKELDNVKPIIWCGDLNVAHNEIDLKNPKTNTKTAGFTKEERKCFTDLLTDGYFDSYRSLYPNETDCYTFWTYLRNSRASNVGWRLDYFVLSERLKENLVDNNIRKTVMGSDHCPIVLFLKF